MKRSILVVCRPIVHPVLAPHAHVVQHDDLGRLPVTSAVTSAAEVDCRVGSNVAPTMAGSHFRRAAWNTAVDRDGLAEHAGGGQNWLPLNRPLHGANVYLSTRTLRVLPLLLLLAHTTIATATESDHSLEPGSWSVQFQVDDDFQLSAFDGLTVSLKQHWTEKVALRMGVSTGYRNTDDANGGSYYTDGSRIPRSSTNSSSSGLDLRFDVLYLRYPSPDRTFKWFWGLGPTMGYGRERAEQDELRRDASGTVYTTSDLRTERDAWSVGGRVALGAEWFATRGLSLHAEYYAVFERRVLEYSRVARYESDSASQESVTWSDTTEWVLDASHALLGLSVYF